MAPIVLTALNAARPALPVIASGLATGARIVGLGAAMGVAYGVGFWTFSRTVHALDRREGRKARPAIDAVEEACHDIAAPRRAASVPDVASPEAAPVPQAA